MIYRTIGEYNNLCTLPTRFY